MKLFSYWRSSSAWRVRLALNLKKIEFEYVAVNLLTGEQRNAEHSARNPLQLVPALEVDGHMLFEVTPVQCALSLTRQSVAIVEYLEETRPDTFRLLPQDPYQRFASPPLQCDSLCCLICTDVLCERS